MTKTEATKINTIEEEKCVFWYYCSYKSCSSCIYVCRNVMPSILQSVDDISVIYTGN